MRSRLLLALVPGIVLGGCSLFGGGSQAETIAAGPRRTTPLVIPPTFALPPPGQAAAPATR